jgi:uncharacterized cupin superfamily protein
MPKLDLSTIPMRRGSGYPSPFDRDVGQRVRQRLGDAGALTQFGVNLLQLPPGGWSSQRHWHTHEDEFVFVVSGTVVLVTDAGEEELHAGDCAAFPAGRADGHHLVNRSGQSATCLEIGSRSDADSATYPDIDLLYDGPSDAYTHKDGTPYPPKQA